jgi:hypothetical protein
MARLLRIAAMAMALTAVHASSTGASVYLLGNSRGDQLLLHQVLGQHNRPFFAGLRPAGGAFAPFTPISEPVDIAQHSAVVDDSGGAVVAWTTGVQDPNPSPGRLFVATRPPGGTFGNPALLATDATLVQLYGNARGDTIVVWYTQGGRTRYAYRPAGANFGQQYELDRPPVGIALDDDGSAHAVFFGGSGSSARLETADRLPDGDFGPRQPIAGTDGARSAILAAAGDGRGLLVWTGGHSVFAMDRVPHGSFGPRIDLGVLPGDLVDALVRPSGAAVIRFGFDGGKVAVRAPGGSFSGATYVPVPPVVGGGTSDLDLNSRGDVAMTWDDYRGNLRAAYRSAGSRAWSQAVTVAPAPALTPILSSRAGLAIAGSGEATIAWEETTGATVHTYARTLRRRKLGPKRTLDAIATYVTVGPPAACRPKGARLLASNASATLFVEHAHVFGCFLKRGAPLQFDGELVFAAHTMSLAGPLVASGYDDDSDARNGLESNIVVTDLRDAEFGISRGAVMEPNAYPATAVLLATRLRPNGAVAWLSCPDESEVRALAKPCRRVGGIKKHLFVWPSHAAEPRLVASSRWIDRRTLKLRGSLLTWRERGKLRHARLR